MLIKEKYFIINVCTGVWFELWQRTIFFWQRSFENPQLFCIRYYSIVSFCNLWPHPCVLVLYTIHEPSSITLRRPTNWILYLYSTCNDEWLYDVYGTLELIEDKLATDVCGTKRFQCQKLLMIETLKFCTINFSAISFIMCIK